MTDLPRSEEIADMSEGHVLKLCSDILRDEAERIRQSQDALVKAGHLSAWDRGRARAHYGLSAVAEFIDRWISEAKSTRMVPPQAVLDAGNVAKSSLIGSLISEQIREEK